MGIDLGKFRQLSPNVYSIRNRNSNTHVMFNWVLEVSNDFFDWYVLDKRCFLSDDNNYNNLM